MTDPTGQPEQGRSEAAAAGSTMSRRDLLQRSAFVVGAAALWATPVVQTIGIRPAAATTLSICEETNYGKPTSMTFKLTPSSYSQNPPPGEQSTQGFKTDEKNTLRQGAKQDDLSTDYQKYYRVRVAKNEGELGSAEPREYKTGQLITDLPTAGNSGIFPNMWFAIEELDGSGGEPVEGRAQIFGFHTSCSQPIEVGWRFASITVHSFEV